MTLGLDPPPQPESPLRALDPRWKLLSIGLAVATVAALQMLPSALLALCGAVLLVRLGRLPPRWYFTRLGLLAPFLGLLLLVLPLFVGEREPLFRLGPVAFSSRGLQLAVLIALKAATIVSLMCVLLASTPFPTLWHAAHALRVPGLIVQLLLLAYRYGFLLTDELARMRTALRVRGYRNRANLHSYRTVAHAAGMLLVRGHERGERVSQAMRCRAFDGRFRSLTEFRTTAAELAFFAAVLVCCSAVLAWEAWPISGGTP